MLPLDIAMNISQNGRSDAGRSQIVDRSAKPCFFKALWSILAVNYVRVISTSKRNSIVSIKSRSAGCQRASFQFSPLAYWSHLPHVQAAPKKKSYLLSQKLWWLSLFTQVNTNKFFMGQVLPAPCIQIRSTHHLTRGAQC